MNAINHFAAGFANVAQPARRLTIAMALVLALSLTSFSADGPAAQADPAPDRPAEAKQLPPQSDNHAVLPEDLKAPDSGDYRIAPGDVLWLWADQLPAGTIETTARVAETGNIAMPRLDAALHVAGMTQEGIRTAVQHAYEKAKIHTATVEVIVTEAQGRAFLILGDGAAADQYAVVSSHMRLLDALALGRPARLDRMVARVIRHAESGRPPRTIDVPLDGLIAGEAGTNISIRPRDTVVILDPRAAGADAAARAAASTTQPSGAAPDAIEPEDLEADKPADYPIAVSDLLKIGISDLTGPGTMTTATQRVTETGNIHPPYLAAVHVAGLTEIGIRDLVVKAYRDQNIIQRAIVEVSVEEARGRAFVVLGAAQANGQFVIANSDFRLLDALALAGGVQPGATTARIIRAGDPTQRARVLDVPIDKLMAGEAGTNIRVRPGDAVVLRENAAASTTQPGSTAVDALQQEDLAADKPADYRIVADDLLKVGIYDLTGPGTVTENTQRVTETGNIHVPYLAAPIHVAGLTETGIRDLIVKAYNDQNIIQRAAVAVSVEEARGRRVVVLGAVRSNGQFSIVAASNFRLLDVLALAGGPRSGATTARVIRKGGPTQQTRVLDVPIDKLLAGEAGTNIRVRPGDAVVLLDGDAAPAPPSGSTNRDTIKPDDLQADEPTDYRIGVCDLVKFELRDLVGPGAVTQLSGRVSETGNVLLPYLDAPVHVAGLTEIGIRDLLAKAYQDRLHMHLGVSVSVTEAHGRTFLVLGAAQSPGQFSIINTTDFRLLDALAQAGGPQPGANVSRVIRKGDPTQPARIIDVPIEKLLAGDAGSNIRVRPGDTVVLLQKFAAEPSSLAPLYPSAPRGDAADELRGVKVPDPYRWLEHARSSETRAWADAENRLTASFVAGPVRDRIEAELTRLWNYPTCKLPHREGDRYFFEKRDVMQAQDVVYRLDKLGGEPTMVLDPNTLSADGSIGLKAQAYSFDGKLLAYGISVQGSDRQEIHVRDIDSSNDLPDIVRWTRHTSIAWKPDNSGFYYNRYPQPGTVPADDENNFCKIYLHRLGTPQEKDELVLERPDDKTLQLSPQVTGDGKYLVVNIRKETADGNRIYCRAADASGEFVKLLDTPDAFYSFIDNAGTTFYFLTNLNAPRWKVIAVDLTQPARENWKTVVPESADEIMSVSTVNSQFAILYLHDAFNVVKIYDLNGSFVRDLPLPRYGSVELGNSGQEDTEFFLSYASFATPTVLYRYDFTTRRLEDYQQSQFKADLSAYQTTEVFVPSADGTRVPMFLTYRKGMKLDGSHPVLMYGYGGFGVNTTPRFYFEVPPFIWLSRGGIYAEAIIRGGAEYGEPWHRAGMLGSKQHTFDDFEACARWLEDRNYTTPSRLAIIGGSNGGLVTAACMLQTPELFGAVVSEFPVTDMLRYTKFAAGKAWLPEYGDADESTEMFHALLAYSPLQNVKAGASYPPVLVTTADDDDRVDPSHARKFVAALQAAESDLPPGAKHNPVLLRIDARAGHLGGNVTSRAGDICAFLFRVFRMDQAR